MLCIPYGAPYLRSRRANAHLLVKFNAWASQRLLKYKPKLTLVLIWKIPVCLKFGKTSDCAVETLPQRKLWAPTELQRERASSETIDLRTFEFGPDWLRSLSTSSERVTHLHIPVPAITRGTLAGTLELKKEPEFWESCYSVSDAGCSEYKIEYSLKKLNLWPGYWSRCSTTELQETCGS